jgi:hypothetical protein
MMKKKKRTTKKTPWQSLTAFAAALAMVVSMGFAAGITAEPSHAAGSYEITGQYVTENFGDYSEGWPEGITSLPNQLETTFSLYKVGHYSHVDGKSVIVLDEPYSGITLPEKQKDDYSSESEWIKEWLSVAQTISQKVTKDTPKAAEDQKANKDNDWKFSFSGLDTGVYLLMGTDSDLTKVPGEKQTTFWRPQPMLIQVFEGSAKDVKVKPEAETAHNFRVTKYWKSDKDDEAIENAVRPKSVTVKIYYDKANNADPVYTEKLNSENSWSFAWTATKDKNDPYKWTVEEQALGGEADKYYTYSIEPVVAGSTNDGLSATDNDSPTEADINNTGNLKIFKLTNTFEPAELELTKKLPKGFVNHSDNVSTTFVFEITGFKKNDKDVEEQIYHKYVSLVFDKDGNLKQNSKTVKYIPVGLSRLVVREVQAANYDVDKAEKTYNASGESDGITFADNTYTVEFSNDYNGKTQYSGGAINKFKLNDEQSGFTVDGHEGKTLGDSDKN